VEFLWGSLAPKVVFSFEELLKKIPLCYQNICVHYFMLSWIFVVITLVFGLRYSLFTIVWGLSRFFMLKKDMFPYICVMILVV
jgi:hypothetical protein